MTPQKPEQLITCRNPDDQVIGVEINGKARAYPHRILNWHEVVNDKLGGEPILISYCPLCDSNLVFDRNINGEIREFGVSGILYLSNVVMFDRQSSVSEESLWSQIEMRTISGAEAPSETELTLLPARVTKWNNWKSDHPRTTVLDVDTG
mgnify:CR=1 FL=1